MTPAATEDRWMSAAEADRYAGLREGSIRALCLLPTTDPRRMPHASRPGRRSALSFYVRKSDLDAALLKTGEQDHAATPLATLLGGQRPGQRRRRVKVQATHTTTAAGAA